VIKKTKSQTNPGGDLRTGLLFASPWLLGLLIFGIYPICASLYYSLCRYNILKPAHFVGLENFRLLAHDRLFWKSLYNTLWLTAIGLPIQLLCALGAAVLLNARVKGQSIFRTCFYLPSLVPAVATAIVWLWIFNPELGILNAALRNLHIPTPGWMTDPNWSKPALVLVSIWGMGGTMVIFLAGLQQVPASLYEAALVDGANRWQRFRHVTIPVLSPVIFFNLIMGIIASFQYFTHVYVMTASLVSGAQGARGVGGPEASTLVYPLYLYQNAFLYFRMGYASAMAWILFLIIGALVWVVFKTSGWVHYEGKD
jgi:multiple sugar transport system permease protein